MRPQWPTGGDGWKDGRTEGQTEGQMDERLEIPPCVLQDIGPLGPLPKEESKERKKKKYFIYHSANSVVAS